MIPREFQMNYFYNKQQETSMCCEVMPNSFHHRKHRTIFPSENYKPLFSLRQLLQLWSMQQIFFNTVDLPGTLSTGVLLRFNTMLVNQCQGDQFIYHQWYRFDVSLIVFESSQRLLPRERTGKDVRRWAVNVTTTEVDV